MEREEIIISKHEIGHGSVASYTIGFILSLVFTIIPYYIVTETTVGGWLLLAILMGFAVAQLLVQVIFFLHLGRESKPRWNLLAFLFMLLVVVIIVIGSLWIMDNLHYNMMPTEVEEYIFDKEAITPTNSP